MRAVTWFVRMAQYTGTVDWRWPIIYPSRFMRGESPWRSGNGNHSRFIRRISNLHTRPYLRCSLTTATFIHHHQDDFKLNRIFQKITRVIEFCCSCVDFVHRPPTIGISNIYFLLSGEREKTRTGRNPLGA